MTTFTHTVKAVTCNGCCSNHCRLTVNTFDGGRRFIGGNRCEQPVAARRAAETTAICTTTSASCWQCLRARQKEPRARIGIPMGAEHV